MKMKDIAVILKGTLPLALCALGLFSCRGGGQQQSLQGQGHTALSVYLGVIPSADCAGIEVSLTLEDSTHATYTRDYIGPDRTLSEQGTYIVEDSVLQLMLPHDTLRFALAEERLILLAEDGGQNHGSQRGHNVLYKRRTYNFVGTYGAFDSIDGERKEKALLITPEEEQYLVSIVVPKAEGKGLSCFTEVGTLRNDTLFVPLARSDESATMCIVPSHDQQGVKVSTTKPEDRHALTWYCGGGSMAGTYYKSTITKSSIGGITSEMTIGDILKRIPEAQVKRTEEHGEFADDRYDNYIIYTRLHEPLLSLSPKERGDLTQRVNRVCVLSPLLCTESRISNRSTFGQIRKAYPITRIESDKEHIIVVVDEIHAHFAISKSKLPPTGWDKKAKRVDASQIPDTAQVDSFTLWWE